ncbi:uncharacterized protein BXZ73DRAFT_103875 [Epithele typhae]|uniref:uncharacterized protein n=1 Tax=Epithele typhae TaxID=378194 RepID=UPI0020074B24|nr:uncharacterized protein BXZ73DRAFT_103875 [Epithele typhae]KAH9923437.1 hypothetical protein BXZ73DRAFT_103875 [Epithele typhae]
MEHHSLYTSEIQPHLRLLAGHRPSQPKAQASCHFGLGVAIANVIADALPELTVKKACGGVDYAKRGEDFAVIAKKVLHMYVKKIETAAHWKGVSPLPMSHDSPPSWTKTTRSSTDYDTGPQKPEYGAKALGDGRRVLNEYFSPNIAKSLRVDHLRRTTILPLQPLGRM